MVAPHAGAWIETARDDLRKPNVGWSLPTRERGLKLALLKAEVLE